jgi:hypothetical protein
MRSKSSSCARLKSNVRSSGTSIGWLRNDAATRERRAEQHNSMIST